MIDPGVRRFQASVLLVAVVAGFIFAVVGLVGATALGFSPEIGVVVGLAIYGAILGIVALVAWAIGRS